MRKYPKSVLVRLREEDFAWLEGARGREDRGEFVRRLVELARVDRERVSAALIFSLGGEG
jgi:hypothetical protein